MMKKGWFIRTPTQELFEEVIKYDVDIEHPLTSKVWLQNKGDSYICYDDSADCFCYGSVLQGNQSGLEEITIEEFREMVGATPKTKQVGDINSNEKGSGARYNSGKPDYSLVLLSQLHEIVCCRSYKPEYAYLLDVLNNLALFQQTHDVSCLYEALNDLGLDAIEESTYVFSYGKVKYAAWNWAKGMVWSVPLACAVRHLLKIVRDNEEVDEESGRLHVGMLFAIFQC